MTVSNSNNFNLVRNQIIEEAFKEIGVKTPNRSLTAEEMNDGAISLNLFVKSLISNGSFLWKTQQAVLFLEPGISEYFIDGTTANCTEDYDETVTTADASSGASSIVVEDTTGFTIGFFIGVYLDDNSIQWTTISNIASLTITLTDALTDDVTSGNAVYCYETKLNRPEKIQNAQATQAPNQDVPMVQLSRDTYYNIPVKDTSGRPNQFYYNKQLNLGIINLWPTPNSSANKFKFTFIKQLYDFDSPTDDPDFPVEWLMPIILNVAYRLSRKYGRLDMSEKEQLKRDADEALQNAEGYDREPTSIYFQPASSININSFR